MRNILITGGSGFVGSSIVQLLSSDDVVFWNLDLPENNDKCRKEFSRKYTWQDLEDIPWSEVDTVIHLAGIAHDVHGKCDEKIYYDVNVGLTAKLLDAITRSLAVRSGLIKLVFFSSVKAVADTVNGILNEDCPPQPATAYGKSKLEAEVLVQNFGALTKSQVVILRPAMIHGPGNSGNLLLLVKLVKKGLPWPLGSYRNSRTFCGIRNICYVVDEIIQDRLASGTYNIADDEAVDTNDLIRIIAQSQQKKARIIRVSPSLVKSVAFFGDKIGLPLNSERLRKLTESYVVSNVKLLKALGKDSMPFTTAENLEYTMSGFSSR